FGPPHFEDPGAKKRRRPAAILAVAHDSPGALHSFGLFVDEHVAAAPLATERTGKRLGVREQDPRLADLEPARDGGDPPADAERGGFAVEVIRGFVEPLADPEQAAQAKRIRLHAQRAREVVGAL